MNTMPLAYLEYVHLEFVNGRVWQINIKEQLNEMESFEVAAILVETMSENRLDIVKLDFKVDIDKLKKDIQHYSNRIL